MKKSTSTTSEDSSETTTHYGVENWRNVLTPTRVTAPERNDEVKRYFENTWPASESYVSGLNPIFLLDLPSVSKFSSDECWLVRDGLIPLLWFFTNNPEPARFRGKLRIHSDFEAYVPEAWRPQVELYELFSDTNVFSYFEQSPETTRGAELLLTGPMVPSICSINQLEGDLKKIVAAFGGKEKLASVKIKAFLPSRFEDFDYSTGPSFSNVFLQMIFRELGLEIEFFEYEGFQWMPSSSKIWFHEFNQKLLYADSFLTLQSLSKGHKPLLGPQPTEEELSSRFDRVLPIFPFVSCGIRGRFEKKFVDYNSGGWTPESKTRAKSLYLATSSPANRNYPWPRWFSAWCRDVQSTSQTP